MIKANYLRDPIGVRQPTVNGTEIIETRDSVTVSVTSNFTDATDLAIAHEIVQVCLLQHSTYRMVRMDFSKWVLSCPSAFASLMVSLMYSFVCSCMNKSLIFPNSILSGTDARCISRSDNSHIGCTYVILITPIPSSSSYDFQRPT